MDVVDVVDVLVDVLVVVVEGHVNVPQARSWYHATGGTWARHWRKVRLSRQPPAPSVSMQQAPVGSGGGVVLVVVVVSLDPPSPPSPPGQHTQLLTLSDQHAKVNTGIGPEQSLLKTSHSSGRVAHGSEAATVITQVSSQVTVMLNSSPQLNVPWPFQRTGELDSRIINTSSLI
ncbi:hypothetical protein SH661x_004323 [Planctomicrobium sp. SH661]|uniref:hypothetical protein n=1 Tax=Planctomicrobium sp. SH661 TaxID=3448124 RepID=UPI003F5B40E2